MSGYLVNAGAFGTPGLDVRMIWAVKADDEAEALNVIRASGAFPPSGRDFSIAAVLSADETGAMGLIRKGQAKPL